MYYRAGPCGVYRGLLKPGEAVVPDHPSVIAYAESSDGIHWTRPSLKLYEFNGSRDNNIVWIPPSGIWSPGDSADRPNKSRFPCAPPGCGVGPVS